MQGDTVSESAPNSTLPAPQGQSNLRFYGENIAFVGLTSLFTWIQISKIIALVNSQTLGVSDPYFTYRLINGLVFLAFNLMLILAFLTRTKPKVQAANALETLVPIISSYFILFYNLPFVPQGPMDLLKPHMIPLSWTGYFLALAGGFFGIYSVMHLRRSFAIFADVRKVVTSGPYRFVRHPLYMAESMVILGVGFTNPNPIFALILAAHIATLVWRARIEEAKLALHSPEYRAYMSRTGRFFPRSTTASDSAETT
jgi:protein-S-isoprenylcysteine O-methyltransferase Ste14